MLAKAALPGLLALCLIMAGGMVYYFVFYKPSAGLEKIKANFPRPRPVNPNEWSPARWQINHLRGTWRSSGRKEGNSTIYEILAFDGEKLVTEMGKEIDIDGERPELHLDKAPQEKLVTYGIQEGGDMPPPQAERGFPNHRWGTMSIRLRQPGWMDKESNSIELKQITLEFDAIREGGSTLFWSNGEKTMWMRLSRDPYYFLNKEEKKEERQGAPK